MKRKQTTLDIWLIVIYGISGGSACSWVFGVSLGMYAMTKFFSGMVHKGEMPWPRSYVPALNHRISIPGMLHSSRSNVSDAETEGCGIDEPTRGRNAFLASFSSRVG